jgi:hypothetical protein
LRGAVIVCVVLSRPRIGAIAAATAAKKARALPDIEPPVTGLAAAP